MKLVRPFGPHILHILLPEGFRQRTLDSNSFHVSLFTINETKTIGEALAIRLR
ncbi:MAG TPA: hypothetical protein VGT03_04825 [Candidatus Acidoferrales bacterium]|nr:hypothetical protein [Candidatus Acidoferrales bacterium]